ncbi:NUDIX hydrolase [Pararhizobium sp.]|uniref:NUDIX hydrolase n=1 Tax=Pararhizobium sp. TaxID=1977563 RepID=UPI002717236E|nr:hypothetical protein [Pararhizobium sp.]MDO9415065.1 hypothetical protein [Pararhizobium sp.]
MTSDSIHAELIAVLTAVTGGQPRVMTIGGGGTLPSGPFETGHRSLQQGLRAWVEEQTGSPPGYLEQLYTFADADRRSGPTPRAISISYLGLMREHSPSEEGSAGWRGWYGYFPWEDHRSGRPAQLDAMVVQLERWAGTGTASEAGYRRHRIGFAFGALSDRWNEDLVLHRYELLYEAGLVAEAPHHGAQVFGQAMGGDHRRILATGIARLRAKIKYRPVVYELMPPQFTLLKLQRTVEALAGLTLYKPNFRRLIEQSDLVEETGESESETGGRPAKLFRFRANVLEEREFAGSKLPLSRI